MTTDRILVGWKGMFLPAYAPDCREVARRWHLGMPQQDGWYEIIRDLMLAGF